MKVHITNVRLAFPNLFEARAINGEGDPRYSAAFIIDPKSPNVATLDAAVKQVATEAWKAKAPTILQELARMKRMCFLKEPKTNGAGEVYDGFAGMFSLNASNKTRVLVLDANRAPLLAKDGRPYGGCYVNAIIDVWAQDNQYGKRVNATLKGVQFVRDGDAFGGGAPASADEFEDVSAQEEPIV